MGYKPKKCKVCGKVFQPKSGRAKYCSVCRVEKHKQWCREYHRRTYKPKGAYKWEMPKGKDSPFYKTGIGIFRRIAFEHYPHECCVCKSTKNLCVHHLDENRHNNEIENLRIVCKSCHQKIHNAAEHLQDPYIKERTRKAASLYQKKNPKPRDSKGRFISTN